MRKTYTINSWKRVHLRSSKRMMNLFFSGMCIIAIISACQHDIIQIAEEVEQQALLDPCNPVFIHYLNDIQPIISSSCAIPGCHDNATPAVFIDLSTYDAVLSSKVLGENIVIPGNANQSKLYRVLRAMDFIPMPPPFNYQISNTQKNQIKLWIDQGAQNLEACLDISCDTTKFDWNTTIRPIIRTYCNGCHYKDYPAAGVNLDFFSQIQELALDGDLYNTITGDLGLRRMPLDAALPDCKIIQIRKWIENGALKD